MFLNRLHKAVAVCLKEQRERAKSAKIMGKLVRKALTDDLRKKPWKGDPNPIAGHCYVASEALYHLLGVNSGWEPNFMYHDGVPHWYLRHNSGIIADLTEDQFISPPDYAAGKGKGFPTREPSKRAKVVIERVRSLLELAWATVQKKSS